MTVSCTEKIKFDFNYMMADYLGENGIDEKTLKELEPKLQKAFADAETGRETAKYGKGWNGWMRLPTEQEEIVEKTLAVAEKVRAKFKAFVVFGIGGSALGPIALHQALKHTHYNELSDEKRGGPRFYVEDNIDPERVAALFDLLDDAGIGVENTCFNVITKSGTTPETMSQFLIVKEKLEEKLGKNYQDNIIATTDKQSGIWCSIATDEGYEKFVIPDNVGGRFSEICPVGLLPAAVCGIDIKKLLAGAAYMDSLCSSDDYKKNPALMSAALLYASYRAGKNIAVVIPYADSLKFISDWYAQLLAESLGKELSLDGETVHEGITPVKALGATDQHSQLQLYSEGPFDKTITFIGVDDFRCDMKIPCYYGDIPRLGYLGGHTLSELIKVEQKATEYALYKAGKMSQTITLPVVNEFTIGQLLYFYMLQIAYAGSMLNINPFNQPGVEGSKKATAAMMHAPGSDAYREEMASAPAKNDKFIY